MNWKFELDGVEVDEPVGMDEFAINIQRDEKWHGVFIEASASRLQFYGAAYRILQAAKQQYGVDANVIFTVSLMCEGETEYSTAVSGRLNFSEYKEDCGDTCLISMNVEQNTCAMVFKNRFDQKVNIDSNIAFDKTTLLDDYAGLGVDIQLATQVIPISADGNVVEQGDVFSLTENVGVSSKVDVRPIYGVVRDNSIHTGQLNDPYSVYTFDDEFPMTPQVLMEENIVCVPGEWAYNVRMKGRVKITRITTPAAGFRTAFLYFVYWDGISAYPGTGIELPVTISAAMTSGVYYEFDTTFTGTVVLPQGVGVYCFVHTESGGGVPSNHVYDVVFDTETSFLLSIDKKCPPTVANMYLVNELLSRCTEAITDRCLTVKSDYYGRTDSLPYDSTADGCGGLRMITNGLKIRQATSKLFFASMEEIMNGLRAIDNIGMGMEANTVTNSGEWVRIEPAEYFYQDVKLLELPYIPKASSELQGKMVYSNIRYGYNNWEIKSIKGIDEFNSYKERRTSIRTVSNELDITTDLIAAGYVIDDLRSSTLAISGETDSTYDDDLFIICVTRDCGFYVEFFATGNNMVFEAPGNGTNFTALMPGNITIAGSASNNGTRTLFVVSVTSLPNNRSLINIGFTGGVTVDEISANVNFTGITFGGFCVEQGVADNAANFYSPATAYNWRIRPMYNLMRWFKSISQAYVNLANTTSKLFFTFGKGNYLAEGELPAGDPCKLENKVLAENTDLAVTDFAVPETPIYKPETMTFEYPLSISEYLNIKANPYGYLEVQCGNGTFEKAYIKSISYKLVEGKANFNLIKKWV